MSALRTTAGAGVCRVLREDPELADALEPDRRAQAIESLVAQEVRFQTGPWRGRPILVQDGIGLLLLEGLLLHRVGIDERYGAEIVGTGDVLHPVADERETSTLPLSAQWTVLSPSRVAVLDGRFVRQLVRFPEVANRLYGRSVDRARRLAINMAIVHQARVDLRLHLLFWHLAGRWGRVRSDGVLVPLRLTHAVLSDLVAARRPTVTSALAKLNRDGVLSATDGGWLLSGPPPGDRSGVARPGR